MLHLPYSVIKLPYLDLFQRHNPVKEFVPLKEVKVGQEVCIAELNQLATVLALPDKNNDVLVRAGIIKTKVPLKGLKQPEKVLEKIKRMYLK